MEKNLPSVFCSNTNGWKKRNSISFKKLSLTFFVGIFVFLVSSMPGQSLSQSVTTITLNSLSTSSVCSGGNLDVNFSSVATGTNTYTVQLSDNAGSFNSPTDIGTADFTDNVDKHDFTVTIPSSITPGGG